MNLEETRSAFPILARYAYLNAGTFGPLARSVVDAMVAEHKAALELGRITPELFERMLALRDRVRGRLAATISVPPELVALTSSTTDGCHVVISALSLNENDEVVTTDSEHFGLIGPLLTSRARVRVARVRDRPAAEVSEVILEQVTPRTRLIALSHVTWVDGKAIPFAEIKEATGLPVLVDGAQSAGAIAVDASAADFYTISAQKWLCGPDLTGALYVADPEALPVALPSYLSQQRYDLEAGTFEPRAGAPRFDTHFTPMASLAGLDAALDLHPDWGIARAAQAAARCRELLADRVEVVTEAGQSTLVSFRVDLDPTEVARRLYDRGVIVRDIPGTGLVRASCGWWTSDEDLARLAQALGR
jgi:L-cysteine/cystine lyase